MTTSSKKSSSTELLAARIYEIICQRQLAANTHLKEMQFANELKVSRTPIRAAFSQLQEQGLLIRKPNQGFFLAADVPSDPGALKLSPATSDSLSPLCYQIGQDYLNGHISKAMVENDLINKYQVNRKSLQEALIAMEKEGWLTRSLGYGWEFKEFISSPKAYAQSYRFRQLIESEALREPGYFVDHAKLHMLKLAQHDILNHTDKLVSAAQMFNAGVLFHETIVGLSGNVFLLDALQRVNRLRRLIEYNVHSKRSIPKTECEEHLQLIELIDSNKLEQAAAFLHKHLERAAKEKEQIASELFSYSVSSSSIG
ncbi:GntR family transcriptional regulator [Agarivorans sp. B2Z047]|uniref:GntR family transcriptional regulator n=1 Tax=unclassified Agarivorans TaxID=2636026 RepID=UPI00128DF665|nr:GntR family transcriptional regulator [Agarivorans sp. B2Z047]MPW28192.1 GntR family transcriptional regulator [Agarivorans sp. B2Z047]UQN43977.1 GntR family transcriptional regulator [Agarivorans sp. B2Z047]